MEERNAWARSVEGAVKDAHRSSVPMRNRVARPGVVLAAEPALTAVAATLRNDNITVSRAALDAVRTFMTDGIDSPLYGRDPLASRRGADALRDRLAGAGTEQRPARVADRATTV
ncbi:MAG TPA: hypothetical protein VFD90_01455 [Gaiellales bacterium]|nr:hypothetical protein [Gaiellales bacterium]